MRSYWIRVGPNELVSWEEKETETRRYTGEGRVTSAETGVTHLCAKEGCDCLQPPGARERQGNILPLSCHGQHGSANSILDFCFPKCERVNCCCFKSGRLQWFVKAVLAVLVNDKGASPPCGSSHFCTCSGVPASFAQGKRGEKHSVLQ